MRNPAHLVRADLIDWQLVGRLSLSLAALTLLPVALGIALDLLLGTGPLITLFMMLLGFNLGVFTIARNVGQTYARYDTAGENSPTVGGKPL